MGNAAPLYMSCEALRDQRFGHLLQSCAPASRHGTADAFVIDSHETVVTCSSRIRHIMGSSNLADPQDWDYHCTSCSGLRMLATVCSQVPALSDLCCLHRFFSRYVSLYGNLQVRRLRRLVPLQELKQHSSGELEGMVLLSKGRLSVQPVTKQQWDFILQLAEEEPKEAS